MRAAEIGMDVSGRTKIAGSQSDALTLNEHNLVTHNSYGESSAVHLCRENGTEGGASAGRLADVKSQTEETLRYRENGGV